MKQKHPRPHAVGGFHLQGILHLMQFLELLQMLAVVVVLAVIAYWGANMYFKIRISRELMEHETPCVIESEDRSKTLLVLGDSTGVGVGAEKCEHTVAGRLAEHLGATWVENYAESGAEVSDLKEQIAKAKLERYDHLLIQIGGNDILLFHSAKKTAGELADALAMLPSSDAVYIMSAGNVGGSTMFPHIIRPFYTALNLQFHKEFGRVAHAFGATYINLFEPFWKDPFLRDPARYLSLDGLHPSSYGYGLWFDKLRAHID